MGVKFSSFTGAPTFSLMNDLRAFSSFTWHTTPRDGTEFHHFASLSIELGLTVESLQLHASADGKGEEEEEDEGKE